MITSYHKRRYKKIMFTFLVPLKLPLPLCHKFSGSYLITSPRNEVSFPVCTNDAPNPNAEASTSRIKGA
jgi:hypothetical protein